MSKHKKASERYYEMRLARIERRRQIRKKVVDTIVEGIPYLFIIIIVIVIVSGAMTSFFRVTFLSDRDADFHEMRHDIDMLQMTISDNAKTYTPPPYSIVNVTNGFMNITTYAADGWVYSTNIHVETIH